MNKTNRLVVKDNALIDASFNLSLIEQRIMLLAVVAAREVEQLSDKTPIEILVSDYIEQFKLDKSNNVYTALKDAVKTLKRREFSYLDRYKGFNGYSTENWVKKVTYIDDKGMIVLYLNDVVIGLISRLEQQFTKYHLDQVSDFKSKYSTRLYELIIKWLNKGVTELYEINDLRSRLGIGVNEYSTMSNFKTNVLDKAITEINKHTRIAVKYTQAKQGRTITGFTFKLKPKTTPATQCAETISLFSNLNNKQAKLFAGKLAADPALSDLAAVGESTTEFAARLEVMLLDLDNQKTKTQERLKEALKRAGFNS